MSLVRVAAVFYLEAISPASGNYIWLGLLWLNSKHLLSSDIKQIVHLKPKPNIVFKLLVNVLTPVLNSMVANSFNLEITGVL